ncbi:MAG: GyrI-like domain-containing protein [Armatimonadota bacterium]|nr:GyrI-like domain-containing protein [bacterium]
MEPKFITRDEFKVVGMECIGNNQNGEFGRLWEDFMQRMGEIRNGSRQGVYYGVCGCGPECEPEKGICKCGEVGFSYMACVEVSDTDETPAGMVAKTIPAAKYAVFTHSGSLDKLKDTYNYIYQTWLKDSGCELSGSFCFELYDDRFNPAGDNSELDVYLPIK